VQEHVVVDATLQGENTYFKLGLFLKVSTGILVSSIPLSQLSVQIRVMRCHNHTWNAYIHKIQAHTHNTPRYHTRYVEMGHLLQHR